MSAGQGHTRGILAKENEVVWDADRSGLRRCSGFEAGSGPGYSISSDLHDVPQSIRAALASLPVSIHVFLYPRTSRDTLHQMVPPLLLCEAWTMATDEAQPTEYLILRGLQESWLAESN